MLIKLRRVILVLPTPKRIRFFWSIGRLLGILIIGQILRGLFLSFYYVGGRGSWVSVVELVRETHLGWSLRLIHFNGASLIFFFVFAHMFRGILQGSFFLKKVWFTGWTLLFLVIVSAFIGYVLPWGQISLWGATVIINLLRVVPYGKTLVIWLWGGFYVSRYTCRFFFSLHFLVPMVVLLFILVHLVTLHERGSSSPLGSSDLIKLKFRTLFSYKDILNFNILIWFFLLLLLAPFLSRDPVNFNPSDLTNSPLHIQPEWYFLHF